MGPKPSDHPDFFRFPAPPGQSRESSIILDDQGRFWHAGELVEHRGMADAFAVWIGRHPDNGRYVLNNGYDWTYLTVNDAPFFVRDVKSSQAQPVLLLSDQSEEVLDASSLAQNAQGALYCRVKQGKFVAKFAAWAQTRLAPWLVETETGDVEVEITGQRFRVGKYSAPLTRRS